MKHTANIFTSHIAFALTLFLTSLGSAHVIAQSVGLSSKPLLRSTLSDDNSKETTILTVEFAPGGTTGRHLHHGDEYAIVIQGTLELTAEGRETRRVSSGESFHNPRGLIHEARNIGDSTARLNIVFVVDKGKPIIVPISKWVQRWLNSFGLHGYLAIRTFEILTFGVVDQSIHFTWKSANKQICYIYNSALGNQNAGYRPILLLFFGFGQYFLYRNLAVFKRSIKQHINHFSLALSHGL